ASRCHRGEVRDMIDRATSTDKPGLIFDCLGTPRPLYSAQLLDLQKDGEGAAQWNDRGYAMSP
ncbi:MAG: hypothetical protein VX664_12940, partial [Chloroflexota bacterium]|nr:hypothetical protein [Chloroflexota bacterium]